MSCSSGHNDVNINKANVVAGKKNNKRDFDCFTSPLVILPHTSFYIYTQYIQSLHLSIFIGISYHNFDFFHITVWIANINLTC